MFFLFKAAKWLDGKIDEPRKKREQDRLQRRFGSPGTKTNRRSATKGSTTKK